VFLLKHVSRLYRCASLLISAIVPLHSPNIPGISHFSPRNFSLCAFPCIYHPNARMQQKRFSRSGIYLHLCPYVFSSFPFSPFFFFLFFPLSWQGLVAKMLVSLARKLVIYIPRVVAECKFHPVPLSLSCRLAWKIHSTTESSSVHRDERGEGRNSNNRIYFRCGIISSLLLTAQKTYCSSVDSSRPDSSSYDTND